MKPVSKLLGKMFGRLTVLSRAPKPEIRKNSTDAYWNCLCQCGKTTVIRSYVLTTGRAKSCGCLKLEAPQLMSFSLPKYTPEIAAARKVWQSRYTNLSFENFYRISQMPCVYCGKLYCLIKRARQINQLSVFKYNTLDRVDSSLGHTIDNVVPACLTCNCAKLDRSLESFKQSIHDLKNHVRLEIKQYRELSLTINISPLKEKYYKKSVEGIYELTYNDGNLSLEQFYQLSQLECYYCGAFPMNRRKIYQKNIEYKLRENFLYNGLDRIDSNLTHNYDNVVPCCKHCNYAKNNMTLQQFDDWIMRCYNHQINHPYQELNFLSSEKPDLNQKLRHQYP